MIEGGRAGRTSVADDQICLFVLFLKRRLELPHLDYSASAECMCPEVPLLYVRPGVKVGIAALDYDRRVALFTEDINESVGEDSLDQRIEASRADGHEGPHACRARGEDVGRSCTGSRVCTYIAARDGVAADTNSCLFSAFLCAMYRGSCPLIFD